MSLHAVGEVAVSGPVRKPTASGGGVGAVVGPRVVAGAGGALRGVVVGRARP